MKIFLIIVSCLLFNLLQGMEQDNSPELASKGENKAQEQVRLNFSKLTLVSQLQHAFAQTIATHLLKEKALKVLNCKPITFLSQLPSDPKEALQEALTRLKSFYSKEMCDKIVLLLAFHILFSSETYQQKSFYLNLILPLLPEQQKVFFSDVSKILTFRDITTPNETLVFEDVTLFTKDQPIRNEIVTKSLSLFHLSIISNNVPIVQALLSFQVLVNGKDAYENTPLHLATLNTVVPEMLSVLMENGAVSTLKNSEKLSPLELAFKFNSINAIQKLLDGSDWISNDALLTKVIEYTLTSDYGDPSIIACVMKLLKEKKRFKELSPFIKFCFAIATHSPRFFKYYGKTPLVGNIGSSDVGALHIAVIFENKEALVSLLDHGADINACPGGCLTPLHVAIFCEFNDIILTLLQRGADLELPNSRNSTPLLAAVARNKNEIAKILLDCNANTEAVNRSNQTSLHIAAYDGNEFIVKLLLEKGATIEPLDDNELTPLFYAIDNEHSSVIKLLISALAALKSESLVSIVDDAMRNPTVISSLDSEEITKKYKLLLNQLTYEQRQELIAKIISRSNAKANEQS
jgi:ankyrin repeat protein